MVLDSLDYVALAAFIVVVFILGVLFRDGAECDSADIPMIEKRHVHARRKYARSI
jgi:hypothetical protein